MVVVVGSLSFPEDDLCCSWTVCCSSICASSRRDCQHDDDGGNTGATSVDDACPEVGKCTSTMVERFA